MGKDCHSKAQIPRKGVHITAQGATHMRKHWGPSVGRGSGRLWAPVLGFPWDGRGERGSAGLGLANRNYCQQAPEYRVQGLSPVVLFLSPGQLGQVCSGPDCENPIGEVVGGVYSAAQEEGADQSPARASNLKTAFQIL